ncbi:MAG: hypothetical protein ABL957_02710 [Parvularculaceae bacterium]
MDEQKRTLLIAGAAAAAAAMLPASAAPKKAGALPVLDPVPPLPKTPTPGKPGDFNFLAGEWRIRHLRLRGANEWDAFEGEATCWTILGGVGSVEELRIPARDFSGMGLRLLDMEKKVWSDHWVNAKGGVIYTPGQTGSFENGAGIFFSEDVDNGVPIIAAGVWDKITPTSCRWRQAVTRNSGKTWEQSWIMDWKRA